MNVFLKYLNVFNIPTGMLKSDARMNERRKQKLSATNVYWNVLFVHQWHVFLKKWENHPNVKQRNASGKPKSNKTKQHRIPEICTDLEAAHEHHSILSHEREFQSLSAIINRHRSKHLSSEKFSSLSCCYFLPFSDAFSSDSVDETFQRLKKAILWKFQ